ncbi:hypothetical protein [uncultured Tateyamaria sp.]|uniref:hypothetical protein n=1 Tax=uncultured Tateyamaria sp. TaxID=455651 RepID=UPI00261F270B|nr:hypothetical protein [uncultured Tateyamaria sp.]
MDDPKETRMIQTRDGVERIPRTQIGVGLRDYFQNTELPEDIERAQVFATSRGPVLAPRDPVPWTEAHAQKVKNFAQDVKSYIDEKGSYKWKLGNCAETLSNETGYPASEMKAHIVAAFEDAQGQDPFKYLQGVRAEQGLPVRGQEQAPDQSFEL